MKLQDTDESGLYRRLNRNIHSPLKVGSSAVRSKSLWTLIGVGVLCFSCYFIGSMVNSRTDAELAQLKLMIKESSLSNSRAKRDISAAEGASKKSRIAKTRHRRDGEDVESAVVTPSFVGGVTYTRWGRRDCPSGTHTRQVYQGVAAGSHYTHTGGGSNLLCLDYNVTYTPGRYIDGFHGSSYIYGVEYRMAATFDPLFDFSQTEGAVGSYRMHAMPCAVCLGESRVNQLMIPGREVCPDGWVKEYTGYIVGSAYSHKHSGSYICVDDTPQVIPGSNGDQAGQLLYMVETHCPSLPCEPFVHGRELRCVVCTI